MYYFGKCLCMCVCMFFFTFSLADLTRKNPVSRTDWWIEDKITKFKTTLFLRSRKTHLRNDRIIWSLFCVNHVIEVTRISWQSSWNITFTIDNLFYLLESEISCKKKYMYIHNEERLHRICIHSRHTKFQNYTISLVLCDLKSWFELSCVRVFFFSSFLWLRKRTEVPFFLSIV